jgi:hypothetical protein
MVPSSRVAVSRVAVAVTVWLGVAAGARAQVDSPTVRAGVAAYEALDYARAVSLLERARKSRLTISELAVTLETLGSAKVILGDDSGARADFAALLRLLPGFTMDRATSPRIRVVFEEVRAKVLEPTEPKPADVTTTLASPPVVAPSPPRAVAPSSPGRLGVRVEPSRPRAGSAATVVLDGTASFARLDLSTRMAGRADYRARTLYPGGASSLRAQLGGDELAAPALELFAVALSASGSELAHAGSPAAPLRIEVAPAAQPLYRRAWLWGVVGGVAAAALVVGLTVGLLEDQDGTLRVVPH